METNKEWQEYIQRLHAQIGGMERILAMASSSYGLIDEDMISGRGGADGIRQLKAKAERLCRKLETREFEIAIVGLEKAGKSTFANAMMGNDILPSKPARCTYTATSIRYSNQNHAEVSFYSHEEFERNFRDNLQIMGIEHAEALSYRTLSISTYEGLFDNLPAEKQQLYRGTVNEDVKTILTYKDNLVQFIGRDPLSFNGDELTTERFKNFIENPAYAIAVKSIVILSDKFRNMPNAVIFDVPGFDSPTQLHKEQTKARMNAADVIILVAGADKPSLTGPQLEIFKTETDEDGILFNEKIFVFANKADLALMLEQNDPHVLQTNMEVLRSDLKKYRIVSPAYLENRVLPGSAAVKLHADENGKAALAAAGIDDGVDRMIELLDQYYNRDRFAILKKRVNKIQSDIQTMFRKIFDQQQGADTFSLNAQGIAYALELHRNATRAIQRGLDNYQAELINSYYVPKPITEELRSGIIASITPETYGVTEDEMTEAMNASRRLNNVVKMEDVEITLRTAKYKQIYNSFVEQVIRLSEDKHEICGEKIAELFLEGLGVTSANLNYDTLKAAVENYIKEQNNVDSGSGYYRSLVERFSRDLFEILINMSLGNASRWNYFETERANFYSLAMFDVNRNEYAPIDRQPLYYALLFQDPKYADMQRFVDETMQEASLIVGRNAADDPELSEAVTKYAFAKTDQAPVEMRTRFREAAKDPSKARDNLLRRIQNQLDDIKLGADPDTEPRITQQYYDEFYKDKRDKTAKDICDQIAADIHILQQVLRNAAANAINIEKPFLSLETQTIDRLKESLEEAAFNQFVTANISLILAEQFRDIEEEENQRRIRRDICAEIKRILEDMKVQEPAAAV